MGSMGWLPVFSGILMTAALCKTICISLKGMSSTAGIPYVFDHMPTGRHHRTPTCMTVQGTSAGRSFHPQVPQHLIAQACTCLVSSPHVQLYRRV